jgi:hypothetical protein
MTELNIIPECYVDTKVAEIVGQASRKYNHQHGCGDVANRMIKSKNNICLGIIDEDKNKGPRAKYFSEFTTIKEENNLILKRHKERKQYLMLICPEIEQWLMNDARHAQIDPTGYNLPPNLKGFTSICKTQDIDRNEGFYRFIKTLINKNAPSVSTLKMWIDCFKKDQLDNL